ncbi:ubiquitin carboxyl-terminal hydrolase [Baffinella frigidus]|nr:ubiquitin carboxyl-terminal hydrolase [Cryptophyta sp. CCMP2293]
MSVVFLENVDAYRQSLEADEAIRSVHAAQSEAGQSDAAGASGDVDFHFVCFVHAGGQCWELDGLKGKPVSYGASSLESLLKDASGKPVSHGPSSPETLLKDAAKVIQSEFIAKRPDLINFSLLALGPADDA